MILIALGANLPSLVGEPAVTLRAALAWLATRGVKPERVSSYYQTVAWPEPSDPPFVNAVARVVTDLEPAALLAVLHEAEAQFGRTAAPRNAPRALDLDIIDYNGRVEGGPPELPHPRIETRPFVLVPLRDVAPHWRHPVSGRTVSELITALPAHTKMPEKLDF